jgi:hypothetical protein
VTPVSEQERLSRLLNDLAASGFQITPEQRIRVTSLFLELRVSGTMPHERHRLGNLLGPVLCRSAEEQRAFHRIFRYWFPEELSHNSVDPISDDNSPGDIWQQIAEEHCAFQEEARRRLRQAQIHAWRRQLRSLVPTVLVIFVHAVLLQVLLGQFLPQPARPEQASRGHTVEGTQQPGTAGKVTQVPSKERAPSQPSASFELHGRLVTWLGSIAGWLAAAERTLGPATTLVLMLPLGLLALLIASSRKLVSAYARQTQVVARNEFRALLSQGEQEFEAVNGHFFRDIQPMRRQIELPSDEIDVDSTIEATVRAGGYVSPVYTQRRASPEYVVLIDRRHDGDHLARYSRTLAETLERAGVHRVVYYFDRDPRRATLGPGQRMLDLDDLSMLQQSHRLLVFSDGSGLCDMATGGLHPWAVSFAAWPQVVLLTSKDIASWGRLEWLIESELNMTVLPATAEGLLLAARLFDPETPVMTARPHRQQVLMPDVNRLDSFFAIGAWRWVDDIEPPADTIDTLLERLRTGLTIAGFDWLCALAVYPAIYWSLTLFVGSKLLGEDGKALCTAGSMLEIARLPWLEYGHMPNWLRKRLILAMPPELRGRVRSVLESLLLTIVSRNPKDFTLVMTLPAGEKMRHPAESLNRDEQRHDAILIEFMTQREATPTDFRFRSKVALALGLPRARAAFRTLFGRNDVEAMRAAAEELSRFTIEKPLVEVRASFVDPHEFGPDVMEITDYITNTGEHIVLSRPLYLLKRNPNKPSSIMLDQYAISLWTWRKRLMRRFGLWGFGVLSAVLGLVYASFFGELRAGASLLLAALIYTPLLLFWLLLLRPYTKALKYFPSVADKQVRSRMVRPAH